MKLKRRITSVFVALCIALSIVACGTVSVGAVSADKISKVPVYKNRTAFIDSVNKGAYQKTANFKSNFDKVYSFTLADEADVLITYGFRNIDNYGWKYSSSFNLYRDVNLINKIDVKVSKKNNKSLYVTLPKGTYYINAKSTYDQGDTFFLYVGQVKKNTQYFHLSFSRAINGGKNLELKINGIDPCEAVYLDVSNHHELHPAGFWMTTYTPDANSKFIVNNTEGGTYLNGVVEDVYGYEYDINNRIIAPNVTTVTGVKNKQYTGKNVKQTGLVVKSANDNVPYGVTYRNNKNIGKATVTIKGVKGALGFVTKTFKIVPAKISKVNQKISGKNVTLSWSKSKGAKNYVLQKKSGSKWKNVKVLSKTSCKVTVGKGKTNFRVYGTKTVSKVNYNSPYKNFTVNRK